MMSSSPHLSTTKINNNLRFSSFPYDSGVGSFNIMDNEHSASATPQPADAAASADHSARSAGSAVVYSDSAFSAGGIDHPPEQCSIM